MPSVAVRMAGPVKDVDKRLWAFIDQARRGGRHAKWSVYEAAKILEQTGRFRGLSWAGRRRVLARWLGDVDPDIVSEGWAEYTATRGRMR